MTPQEALAHHLSVRPVSPGNVGADHPDYKEFHHMFTLWAAEKERLEAAVNVAGIDLMKVDLDRPSCTPRADYIWRDLGGRKAPNPGYMAKKKRESRAKSPERKAIERERRKEWDRKHREKVRAAVLEVQSERGAA